MTAGIPQVRHARARRQEARQVSAGALPTPQPESHPTHAPRTKGDEGATQSSQILTSTGRPAMPLPPKLLPPQPPVQSPQAPQPAPPQPPVQPSALAQTCCCPSCLACCSSCCALCPSLSVMPIHPFLMSHNRPWSSTTTGHPPPTNVRAKDSPHLKPLEEKKRTCPRREKIKMPLPRLEIQPWSFHKRCEKLSPPP